MAGYRPKSLDELNSLYDKSLNVKNEIDKKASDLEVKQEIYAPVVSVTPEEETEPQPVAEDAAAGEITGLVDDFIKSFGAPATEKKVRHIAPTTLKAVSSAKADEAKAPARQSAPVAPYVPAASDKPRLIRSTERNDLFEDYKKVMDDEDEEEYSRHRLGRKRSKKRHEKKNTQEVAAQTDSNESSTVGGEPAVPAEEFAEAVIEPADQEIPETLENIDAVIEKVLGKPVQSAQTQPAEETAPETYAEAEAEEEKEAETIVPVEEEIAEAPEESVEAYEEEVPEAEAEAESEEPLIVYQVPAEEETDEEAVETEPETVEEFAQEPAVRSFKTKNLLLLALLSVLLLATAVSAVKAFAGINSDSLVLGKYHLYSATENYAQARIKKGDLVVVNYEGVEEGDIFAYKKGDGEYGFAKLEGILNDDSVIADKDGQKSIVFKTTLRGVFYKTIPAIGTFAAAVAAYYLYIIGGLLLVAVILALVIAIAFRRKKEKAEAEEIQEIYAEEEAVAEEGSEYDAVEGDFRYLIQDEGEDEYDIYRKDYDADGEEGLPVDDYKYEPDEYIKG